MGGTGELVTEPVELWRHSRPVRTFLFWRKIQTTQHQRGQQQQNLCRQQHQATPMVRQLATAMEMEEPQQTTATTMGTNVELLEPGRVRLLLMLGVLTTVWPPPPTPTVLVTCASAGRGRGAWWAGPGAGPSGSAVWPLGPGPGTRVWPPGATTTACMTRLSVRRRCATAARQQQQQHNKNLCVFLTTLFVMVLHFPFHFASPTFYLVT